MNKDQMVKKMWRRCSCTAPECARAIDAIGDFIIEELASSGKKVMINGFGKFFIMTWKGKQYPRFTPSKTWMRRFNERTKKTGKTRRKQK
jgi:hypothetical protein